MDGWMDRGKNGLTHRWTNGQTNRISPHSTGLCPLSGLLPCYSLRLQNSKEAGQGKRWPYDAFGRLVFSFFHYWARQSFSERNEANNFVVSLFTLLPQKSTLDEKEESSIHEGEWICSKKLHQSQIDPRFKNTKRKRFIMNVFKKSVTFWNKSFWLYFTLLCLMMIHIFK